VVVVLDQGAVVEHHPVGQRSELPSSREIEMRTGPPLRSM